MADRGMAAVVARRVVFAAAVAAAASASAERLPFDRYTNMIERQMFGPLPPNFDPTKYPTEVARGSGSASEKELTKEQEQIKSAIRFSVINVTPEGETAVGFTDSSDPKKPVHYYLKEGESKGGWEVKEADAKTATMTVAKGDIEVTLSLGGDSSKGAGTDKAEGAKSSASVPSHSGLLTIQARRMAKKAKEAEERRASEAAEQSRREEERARREEAEAAKEEERRMELDRIKDELKKAFQDRQQRRMREVSGQDAESASEDGAASDGE